MPENLQKGFWMLGGQSQKKLWQKCHYRNAVSQIHLYHE
jgi:hypothetical protein